MIVGSVEEWLARTVPALACAWWAVEVLLPGRDWPILVAVGVAMLLGGWWTQWREQSRRAERHVVATALREHRDPGPEQRPLVDREARAVLGRPAFMPWTTPVVLIGLAIACVVVAATQRDAMTALPVLPLCALAAVEAIVVWRNLAAATMWSSDPPYPVDIEEEQS